MAAKFVSPKLSRCLTDKILLFEISFYPDEKKLLRRLNIRTLHSWSHLWVNYTMKPNKYHGTFHLIKDPQETLTYHEYDI